MAIGRLLIELRTAQNALPANNATVRIKSPTGPLLYEVAITRGDSGNTQIFELPVPDMADSLAPNSEIAPYGVFNIEVLSNNFRTAYINGVQVFADRESVLNVELLPLPQAYPPTTGPVYINIGEHNLRRAQDVPSAEPLPPQQPFPQIHSEPFIPEFITVHLGAPTNSSARNVTVRFPDYIKNVASCEIYPTWPEESLRANILAQISLALNRVFTEWYRSRGYNFDITNSTAYDQYYVDGGNIYQSISDIVDEIFNVYIRKPGRIEPFYAEYCNGSTVTCPGMSQWGTVTLANNGLDANEILENYYGEIELVENNDLIGGFESYPGNPLTIGSSGKPVRTIQEQLNRIAVNYPIIPLNPVDGVYGPSTAEQVRVFQRIFNMTVDGVVGKGTWYEISRIYVGIKRLAELTSEGQREDYASGIYPGFPLRLGSRGSEVLEIQLYLSTIAQYNNAVPYVEIDGVYGQTTYNSVVGFQREYGVPADGVVGLATWNRLVDVYRGIEENVTVPGVGENITILPFPGTLLRYGSQGENVRYVQRLLAALSKIFSGIPSVTPDGYFGNNTRAAVIAFQNIFGLLADGIVGEETWNALGTAYIDYVLGALSDLGLRQFPGTVLQNGSQGENVTYVQRILRSLSSRYPSIPAISTDGYFGNNTQSAVIAFQRLTGLSIDGVVGRATWEALNDMYNYIRNVCLTRRAFSGTPLRRGSSGSNVLYMQILLEQLSKVYGQLPSVSIDGFFGPDTETAVRRFQTFAGIASDGIVGRATWDTLNSRYASVCSTINGRSAEPQGITPLSEEPVPMPQPAPMPQPTPMPESVTEPAPIIEDGQEELHQTFSSAENMRTLKIGSSGDDVARLKRRLIDLGYLSSSFVADGFFGASTKKAVEKFQRDNSIAVSGSADEETFRKILGE